jgi:hypothetical protein
MFVSGSLSCEECGAVRYLIAADFEAPPPAVAVVQTALPREAA